MKVPDGGHTERMFTCSDVCTSDGLTCMSKQADQAGLLIQVGDCGSASHGAIGFYAWWCLRQQASSPPQSKFDWLDYT